jgi:hypothetical protein
LLIPLAFSTGALSCGSIPDDPGPRIFPPAGVIRGTVVYQGPHPCSRNGHIVGNAVVLVFDRRNPPPPNGLANTAPNFGDVTGDSLFANEPRYQGDDQTYCPRDHGITETITASGSFEIAPLVGGSYELQAFFDYTGDWLPEFKIRNLPELGDIAGGDIDTADALKPGNVDNANYQPLFIPVNVGTPQPLGAAGAGVPGAIPNYVIPDTGFVSDNVTVTLGVALPLTRPYFYATGGTFDSTTGAYTATQSSAEPAAAPLAGSSETMQDKDWAYYAPILTIPQDIQVLAPPQITPMNPIPSPASVFKFQASFPALQLKYEGTAPQSEVLKAIDPAQPFHMQVSPVGGIGVWGNSYQTATGTFADQLIPEGNNVPLFWPLVVLNKLVDDKPSGGSFHPNDPASLTAQGDPNTPVVIMQGITLSASTMPADTLFGAGLPEVLAMPGMPAYVDPATGKPKLSPPQDHVTALVRPSVICFKNLFDATNPDKRGILVAPYLSGPAADGSGNHDIVPQDLLTNTVPNRQSVKGQVSKIVQACLPKGRYAINLVYPDGQAWTVPNEAGGCTNGEGAASYPVPAPQNYPTTVQCTAPMKERPVLLSQGPRAVVEIVGPTDPQNCIDAPNKVPATPAECLPPPPQP